MIQELKSVDAMYSAKKKRRELNSDERMASYERRLRTRKKGWTSRIISLGGMSRLRRETGVRCQALQPQV
jgi:hypothetical protein